MSPTEVIVGLIGLASAFSGAYLAYRRGTKADDDANENTATAQVYAGYGGLLQRIQEDNTELRRRLVLEAQKCNERIDELRKEIDVLKGSINELRNPK